MSESGRYNIYKQAISLNGMVQGTSKKLTNQKINGIISYSVSSNGTLVFSKGFNIYHQKENSVKKNDKEKKHTNNVNNHNFRDRNPQCINNKMVVFISDRDGHNEIYSTTSKDTLVGLERSLTLETKKLIKTKENIFDLVVSPNQQKIAYRVGRGNLMIADIKEGKIIKTKIFSKGWASADEVC